ncbi:glycosyltransferase family 4 protein [Akkermansiaceae bacterium]|nr:glycosyltransferase family 4 protein [Akkermansiaceae bacterium]
MLSKEVVYATRETIGRDAKTFVGNCEDLTWLPFGWKNFLKVIRLSQGAEFIILRIPSFLSLVYYPFLKKEKILLEVVGCPWDTFRNHGIRGKLLAPFLFLFQRFIVLRAHFVHYVTNDFLQKRYPTRSEMCLYQSDVIIENTGVSLPDQSRIKGKLGAIGAYGSSYKDFSTLLLALTNLKKRGEINLKLEIVGGGDPKILARQIKKFNLEENVSLLGIMGHVELMEWLRTVDIYIHPSKAEGCPRSLIEALASGCLCIGSKVGGIPELLIESNLFKPGDYKTLSRKIWAGLSDDTLDRSNRTLNSFDPSKYDRETVMSGYSGFYKKIKNK